jgi:hypothetical protein
MAPRANWKGYLRLSLVSCPIALYPASSLSEKVSFNRMVASAQVTTRSATTAVSRPARAPRTPARGSPPFPAFPGRRTTDGVACRSDE